MERRTARSGGVRDDLRVLAPSGRIVVGVGDNPDSSVRHRLKDVGGVERLLSALAAKVEERGAL